MTQSLPQQRCVTPARLRTRSNACGAIVAKNNPLPAVTRRDPLSRRRVLLAVAGLVVLASCGKKPASTGALAGDATVLALGDSLTAGVGADAASAWPALLAAQSGWQVVNAGVPGDTSAQALARLPALLDAHQPALVIVSIGGNDFLRQQSAAATRENIEGICQLARAHGAQVLLVAIPSVSLLAAATGRLKDHPLYQQIASEHDVPLLRGAWAAVLSRAEQRADQVHANARGYEHFNQLLLGALRQQGWLR